MEHCEHTAAHAYAAAGHAAPPEAVDAGRRHHATMSAKAETVPLHRGDGDNACKHHIGETCQCKAQMALACGMERCCIKSGGPSSTGLNDRLPTTDDLALNIHAAPCAVDGTMAVAAGYRMTVPRYLPGPDPRPPSA